MTNQTQERQERTDIQRLTRLCDALASPGSVVPPGADVEIAQALLRRDFDPMRLVAGAWPLLLANPQVRVFMDSAGRGDISTLDQYLADGTLVAFYNTPLMQALLRTTVVPDLRFERLNAHVRLRLLECTADPAWQSDGSTSKVASAIGMQAFLTEYIYLETSRETQLVEALQDKVQASQDSQADTFAVAIMSSYRPLHAVLAETEVLLGQLDSGLSELIRMQVEEPNREQAIKADIPTITAIDDAVSMAVQTQYEEHPYPRWVSAMLNQPVTPSELFASACRGVDMEAFGSRESHSLLFAGCGTGKVVLEEGVLWKNADALGLDLSLSSLAYGRRRADEMGFTNVSFARGDLLELSKLGQSYDYISCSGVLHHMADPIEGWRALADVCRPGGVMRVCLYSELARAPVRHVQSIIGDERIGAGPSQIKEIRQGLIEQFLEADAPDDRLQHIFAAMDMYNTSMCRDLLFHVHEQDFTIPRLADAIDSLGLNFCGFVDPERKVLTEYRVFAPEDPDGLDLMSWHRFELRNPKIFAQMYDVMVQKPIN